RITRVGATRGYIRLLRCENATEVKCSAAETGGVPESLRPSPLHTRFQRMGSSLADEVIRRVQGVQVVLVRPAAGDAEIRKSGWSKRAESSPNSVIESVSGGILDAVLGIQGLLQQVVSDRGQVSVTETGLIVQPGRK